MAFAQAWAGQAREEKGWDGQIGRSTLFQNDLVMTDAPSNGKLGFCGSMREARQRKYATDGVRFSQHCGRKRRQGTRCRARSLLVRVVANELALENGWVGRVRDCLAGCKLVPALRPLDVRSAHGRFGRLARPT